MKLSNLEKDFRNKLNERDIQPSDNVWKKLDEKLGAIEIKKQKKSFNWLYVAATITGITFIGIYMMSQKFVDVKNEPFSVVQENLVSRDSTKKTNSPEQVKVINPIIDLKSVTKLTVANQFETRKNITSKNLIVDTNKSITTAENTISVEKVIHEKPLKYHNQISINSQELLASVDNSTELKIKNNTIKIDALGLLSQVDTELELTFKEKALQSINKNFNNLKTAIAIRNIDD